MIIADDKYIDSLPKEDNPIRHKYKYCIINSDAKLCTHEGCDMYLAGKCIWHDEEYFYKYKTPSPEQVKISGKWGIR